MHTFKTIEPSVVHEACEAMRLREEFGPHSILDLSGGWMAHGNVIGIRRIDGPAYCFEITVSESKRAEALKE